MIFMSHCHKINSHQSHCKTQKLSLHTVTGKIQIFKIEEIEVCLCPTHYVVTYVLHMYEARTQIQQPELAVVRVLPLR